MSEEKVFRVGGVELRVDHRTFEGDSGPAVRVMAEVDGNDVQVLRFDCFRNEPHYHYDPAGKDDKRDLDRDEVPDPVAWTIERLQHKMRLREEALAELMQDHVALKKTLGEH